MLNFNKNKLRKRFSKEKMRVFVVFYYLRNKRIIFFC